MSATAPISVLVPLEVERRAITRAIGIHRASHVHTIGPSARSMPMPEILVGSRAILVAGLGGGLDPDLRTGDVVIDASAGCNTADARRGDAPRWLERLADSQPGARSGQIHTADRILSTPDHKQACFEKTGAVVVDMEQAVVAAWLDAFGPPLDRIPIIGVRAVLDPVDRALPSAFSAMVDPQGRTRILAAVGTIARHPRMLGVMVQTGRASSAACRRLGPAVRRIVELIDQESG